jgi:hypothetical protein
VHSVTSILEKAKQYIETFGWIKEEYGSPNNGFCALGAIRAALDVTDYREHSLPPVINDVYKAFTVPLIKRGKSPYRYTFNGELAAITTSELTSYRESLAGAGDILDYNDEDAKSKTEILELFDDALAEARKVA